MERLTKDQALVKFAAFKDSTLRKARADECRAECASRFTRDQLVAFWNETKHLAWPECYGQSPWETAACLGADYCRETESERN